MLDVETLHKVFRHVDFTENEVRLYLALLKKKACSPAEAARMSGLNMKKIYDYLEVLEKKGGCVRLNAGKKLYKPVNPDILLKRAKEKFTIEADEFQECANSASDDLLNLYRNALKADDELDYITVMKDPVQVAEVIVNLLANAKEEILQFSLCRTLRDTVSRVDQKMLAELDEKNRTMEEKIIKHRKVITHSLTGLEQLSEDLIRNTAGKYRKCENVDVRVVDKVHRSAIIIDRRDVLISLESRVQGKASLLRFHIRDEGFAEMLRDGFYANFNNAPSIKDLDVDILLGEKRIVRLGDKTTKQEVM